MIKQSTGEDWKDAEISLSTAQPDIGASPPQLGVHHIGFLRPRAMAVRKGLKFNDMSMAENCHGPTVLDSLLDNCLYLESEQERFSATTGISKKPKSTRRRYSPPSLEVEVAKVSCVTELVCNSIFYHRLHQDNCTTPPTRSLALPLFQLTIRNTK